MLALLVVPAALCTCVMAQEAAAPEGQAPSPPRHNLVRFFDKCRAGGPVSVAYIGGSITEANGWRPFTTKWLREQFPKTEIREINAAIGGTDSLLGAFRMTEHVMQYEPDLLFVEFAVNDSGNPDDAQVKATMEGIVRQAWSAPKKPDIVFTYTTVAMQTPVQRHQAVADAYDIPTVDFQEAIKALCGPGLVDWRILAQDNVHPGDWGHGIYAAVLATYLKQQMALTEAVPPPDTLPPAVFSDAYTSAHLIPATATSQPLEGWTVNPAGGFFRSGSVLGTQVGQTAEYDFTGTMVGLYYEIRKDAGFVQAEIDGKVVAEVDTSWGPTYPFNRLNCTMLARDLAPGPHHLKLTLLDRKHELSAGHELHLGYLMAAG
jgi:lysophospholipase L1-like esterase